MDDSTPSGRSQTYSQRRGETFSQRGTSNRRDDETIGSDRTASRGGNPTSEDTTLVRRGSITPEVGSSPNHTAEETPEGERTPRLRGDRTHSLSSIQTLEDSPPPNQRST